MTVPAPVVPPADEYPEFDAETSLDPLHDDPIAEPSAEVGRISPLSESPPSILGAVVAGVLSFFVFALLNWPDPNGWSGLTEPLLFLNTTPSGGDMGAHVWGPAFLRDHLLPSGQLSGWTPDWYAGFPAYHFYMVVPSLAIVAVNAGLPWFLGIPAAGAVLYGGYRLSLQFQTAQNWVRALSVMAAILLISFPYGVSFKLVSVAGLVMFPLAAWAMGRLARSPEPVPSFLAMAAFIFLFDTNFTIYGGNIASTLAGEFAFSLSLCLTLIAIGMTVRGMDDQRWRAPAAVVIALTALCHIIPVFFLIPALILLVLMHRDIARGWAAAAMIAMALIPIGFADGTGLGFKGLVVALLLMVLASAMAAESAVLGRSLWLTLTGVTAMLLSAFWLLPFYLREPYFNDMGWERLNDVGAPMLTTPIKVALPVAALGLLLSFAFRERLGMMFSGTGLLFAAAVANVGEGPLWNARLLPFYYLSVYMVAAVAVALMVRHMAAAASGRFERPNGAVVGALTSLALVAVLFAVSMPLRIVPFGGTTADGDGSYGWPVLRIGGETRDLSVFTNQAGSFIPGWAEWNYSGYERKPAYAEYSSVVRTMAEVGRRNDGGRDGCGRAMWEYEKGLDRYGTPMALMLLPHWTDGCIGSMEGLYFESSSSTPFHFLNQSTLSEAPSRAQRDLPYQEFDINRGVAQLQVTGVRYYLAQSDMAIEAARQHPDLTEVAEAQPFVVFEVAGSQLVEPLTVEPVVTSGRSEEDLTGEFDDELAGEADVSRFEVGWVSQAVRYYNDPALFRAMPAEDGPDSWQRQVTIDGGQINEIDPVEISNVTAGTDRISFSVDQIGTPVLVKASYFPNWNAEGADGPWRVGPNLMAVIPTSTDVSLHYGRTPVDIVAVVLTVLGLAGLAALGGVDRRRWMVLERQDWDEERDWNEDELRELTGEHPFAFDDPPSAFDGAVGDLGDDGYIDPDRDLDLGRGFDVDAGYDPERSAGADLDHGFDADTGYDPPDSRAEGNGAAAAAGGAIDGGSAVRSDRATARPPVGNNGGAATAPSASRSDRSPEGSGAAPTADPEGLDGGSEQPAEDPGPDLA